MAARALFLSLVRALGGFALARRLTRRDLRILCYHGLALDDEARFQPKLFMRAETFRRRLQLIAARGHPVLPLDDALRRLDDGSLPDRAVVITFDDGWLGIGTLAVPALEQRGFPATIYVTTRDAVEAQPVFNVAIRYLFWKTQARRLDLGGTGLDASGAFALDDPPDRERALSRLSELAEATDGPGRTAILRAVARALDLDWDALAARRLLCLMTPDELAAAAARGIDLQLHTHDHRFGGCDRPFADRTLVENRDALTPLTGRPAVHFCYPSGEYAADQLPWLEALGIESATTCKPGFVNRRTPRLELGRFLDGEHIADIEFEAEISGFLELMRRARAALRPA